VTCPFCGEPLRRSDGSVPRTTVAVLLGLTAAGALGGACGSSSGPAQFYGPAQTTSSTSDGGTGGNGTGGAVTATFYGPSMTTSSSTGTGGQDGG
jgi:hypothetical protein